MRDHFTCCEYVDGKWRWITIHDSGLIEWGEQD